MKYFFSKNNIPNIFTILRILFIPFIVVFLSVRINPIIFQFTIFSNSPSWSLTTQVDLSWMLAGLLFLLASFTDFLDGYLARKYQWISDFGKIWDPIADKLLINLVLITLAVLNSIIWYLVIIMVARDLIVDGYRTFLSSKKIIIPANILGKIKTVLQMIGIIVIFFVFNDKKNNLSYVLLQNIFLILATIVSVISGIYYIFIANRKIADSAKIIDDGQM